MDMLLQLSVRSDLGRAGVRQTHVTARPLNSKAGQKSRFVTWHDGEAGPGMRESLSASVEALVIQAYKQRQQRPEDEADACEGGWSGVHCEGSMLRTLFGLLMWETIFASDESKDAPPVFRHRYQDVPLDLDWPLAFYIRRKCDTYRGVCSGDIEIRDKPEIKTKSVYFSVFVLLSDVEICVYPG